MRSKTVEYAFVNLPKGGYAEIAGSDIQGAKARAGIPGARSDGHNFLLQTGFLSDKMKKESKIYFFCGKALLSFLHVAMMYT